MFEIEFREESIVKSMCKESYFFSFILVYLDPVPDVVHRIQLLAQY